MIHGTGPDADQHLVFSRLRVGYIFVSENLRPAEFVNANGFHGCSVQGTEYTAKIRYGPGSELLNIPLLTFVNASSNEAKRQWLFGEF